MNESQRMPAHVKAAWVALIVALALELMKGGGGIVIPTPKPSGPLRVVLVCETADTRAELARTINALRNGAAAEYIKTKGHVLDVLDDDAVDETGKPIMTDLQGIQLPAMLIYDRQTKQLRHKVSVPANVPADALLAIIKKYG